MKPGSILKWTAEERRWRRASVQKRARFILIKKHPWGWLVYNINSGVLFSAYCSWIETKLEEIV